jgi:hypothetical protein
VKPSWKSSTVCVDESVVYVLRVETREDSRLTRKASSVGLGGEDTSSLLLNDAFITTKNDRNAVCFPSAFLLSAAGRLFGFQTSRRGTLRLNRGAISGRGMRGAKGNFSTLKKKLFGVRSTGQVP